VLRSGAARGDPAAFTALYQRHHQELYRYCRAILRNDEDARDALQSTMAKAFAALRDESRDFELRPWLFRIAHNEAISILRRRRDTTHLDAVPQVAVDSLPGRVADRQRLAELRADLAELPERQRSALVLRELSGLGHKEIAEVLSSSPSAVKQSIFEARKALHEYAEGREMTCDAVQRAMSDADGRVLRGRRIRAHLRSCRSCRDFRTALRTRPADLRALGAPLPVGASAALLGTLLPSAGGGGLAAGGSAAAGGALAGVAAKAAVVATVGAVAVGAVTADRALRTPDAPRHAPALPRSTQARSSSPSVSIPQRQRPGVAPAADPAPPVVKPAPSSRPVHAATPPRARHAPAARGHANGASNGHRAASPPRRPARAATPARPARPPRVAAVPRRSAKPLTSAPPARRHAVPPAAAPPARRHAVPPPAAPPRAARPAARSNRAAAPPRPATAPPVAAKAGRDAPAPGAGRPK
jgi:RNA polymerase sigma factor (sigma-70 family)